MPLQPFFSIIVPVFNRPQELNELLESLTRQTFTDFEVVVIEDGSEITSEHILKDFAFPWQYHFKPNSGPGPSRNVGFGLAQGQNFIVLDSDCICPPQYLETIHNYLQQHPLEVWGGPDAGHTTFTAKQQAMAYTMSAFLTTGGIRGGRAKAFQPRSFNMGMTRAAWQRTNGYLFTRYAEDIEFSIRAQKLGLVTGLIEKAFVYHKRRTDFKQFFKQVYSFGKGRILVGWEHPGAVKLAHWMPAIFTISTLILPGFWVLGSYYGTVTLFSWLGYFLAIGCGAFLATRNAQVAALSLPSAFIQLMGYGLGFLAAFLRGKPVKS